MATLLAGCSAGREDATEVAEAALRLDIETDSPTTVDTPIGLALEIENGQGAALRVRKHQNFFINQVDIRAFVDTNVDEGVANVAEQGDFSALPWDGVHFADQEFVGIANPDGTHVRRRFYRGAEWMTLPSTFLITQVDAGGQPNGQPWTVFVGRDAELTSGDSFFVRRLRAIQWTFDCPSRQSCDGASHFQEEGLVEVRNAIGSSTVVRMEPTTTALRVLWSLKPNTPYTIPVEQVETPAFDYGFRVDLRTTTAAPGGVYAPGSDISFQFTLQDGSANALHPDGSLPTYNDVVFGPNEAGIQYYRAFLDPTTTYYRRKHRERMLMAQIIGPAQAIQPIRSIIDLEAFLGPEDSQVTGLPERDGVFAEVQTVPPANDLFGGAFDPAHAGWAAPVSDSFTFHIPDNAEPGTYLVTVKARRTYLGEDIPRSETIAVQVGSLVPTVPQLTTGPCNTCHTGGSDLSVVLHANDNRAACAGCHVPLGFELEGPIFVRTHFVHSRSNRFDADLAQCSNCHLGLSGIQRTSKAACLSCHTSYPPDHVAAYGPVQSMYIGGDRESFAQCSDSCHENHPRSAL
jgi:hypothetical protein